MVYGLGMIPWHTIQDILFHVCFTWAFSLETSKGTATQSANELRTQQRINLKLKLQTASILNHFFLMWGQAGKSVRILHCSTYCSEKSCICEHSCQTLGLCFLLVCSLQIWIFQTLSMSVMFDGLLMFVFVSHVNYLFSAQRGWFVALRERACDGPPMPKAHQRWCVVSLLCSSAQSWHCCHQFIHIHMHFKIWPTIHYSCTVCWGACLLRFRNSLW